VRESGSVVRHNRASSVQVATLSGARAAYIIEMTDTVDPCYTCASTAMMDQSGPSTAIWTTDGWRVAHSFNSALLGWLVVVPRRHIESIHELSVDESVELGLLLRQTSKALVDVLGCQKTYVMMFAEAAGFNHVHFHFVPRAHDLDAEHRGSSIFEYLKRPELEWISLAEQDELALSLRSASGE
jgi:diadenosine tetraphosphate (Ap4A) HIT family hydrolase